jgi:hypothetical protein
MNGGLQYFRDDVPGGGADHLLTLFNDHVHRLVTEDPHRCLNGNTFTVRGGGLYKLNPVYS